MEPEALVLIERDGEAQKLVVAWPKVDLGKRKPTEVLADEDEKLHSQWSRVSGVPLDVVRRLYTMLLTNGICVPDGTVAPLAVQFIRKRIVEGLK